MSRFNSVILFNCLSLRLRQSLPSNSPQFGGTESGVLHVRSNQLNLISVVGIQFSLKDAPIMIPQGQLVLYLPFDLGQSIPPGPQPLAVKAIWGLWNCMWFRFFFISWRWASRIIFIFLFCFNFVAEAYDHSSLSLSYDCEDVSSYYAQVEHLEGEALKKKLNSIISEHRSLSYKEVWNALKILDAADVDNPEASLGIVEIYSLRVVSKGLAGKPEGWNSELANFIFWSYIVLVLSF
ncbi:hypothetical protein CK203_047587 [Vitis vinifera]|uniref:Uncharacterized protein n=1 Tax=Vitis vinifera TaxID=29760 RepID=A0A438GX03_VITVI|nr:hypothetical protein CK203_047587 [Vitis vinifera]